MKGLKHFFILLFIPTSLTVFAQEDLERGKGYVMSFGKVISGEIKVDLDKNTVLVKEGNKITLLHAKNIQKVSSFREGYEETYYTGSFGMNKPLIFEALSDGNIPLLYREGVKFSEYEEIEYPPYFMLKNNQVFALGTSKKEVFEVFDGRFQKEMTDFAKNNKISFKSKGGLAALFNHYNTITMMAAN